MIGVGGLSPGKDTGRTRAKRVLIIRERQTEGQDEAVENDLLKDQDKTNADRNSKGSLKQKLRWY